jgi:hypothetical protein
MPSSKFALLFFLSVGALLAQPDVGGGITQPASGGGGGSTTLTITNEGTTGTTTNTLTKLTGAPSTAIKAATTDTGGVVGICTSGCSTSGSATIQIVASVTCAFDSSGNSAGHYVQISSATAGDCTDAGATYPTSGQVIGRSLSTNVGAGNYTIDLFPAEIKGASGGGGSAGSTLFTYVNATGVGPNNTASETSLIGTATTGSKTIAANTMTAGQLMQVIVTGQVTTPAVPDNLTLNMYMGATKVATGTVTGTNIANLTTQSISFKSSFYILTGGASCAVLVEDVSIISAATALGGGITKFQGTGNTYDCTANEAFDFKAQWASNQAGESIFGQGVSLYIPGAPVTSVNGATGAVTVQPFFQTLTAPASGSFTQRNYNTGSGVVTTQVNNTSPVTSITILQHDPSNTGNIVALDKAKIAATFTMTIAITYAQSGNSGFGGMYLSDGGSPPNIIFYGYQAQSGSFTGGPVGFTFTNFTTFGSTIFTQGNNLPVGGLLWLRIKETASNRLYYSSSDGITFAQTGSEANTAHFTTSRYGVMVADSSGSAGAPDTMISWYSFAETTP